MHLRANAAFVNNQRSGRRLSLTLAVLFVMQLLLGAGLHFHQLGDFEPSGSDTIHADFSHELHGDQSGLDADPVSREQSGDWSLDLVLTHWPQPILITAAPVDVSSQLVQAPQPPPRHLLPQPRGPPHA